MSQLIIIEMLLNNNVVRNRKSTSNKKVHRRVATEAGELPRPPIFRHQIRQADQIGSRPKFTHLYSKYVPKETHSQRKNFKITQNRPLAQEKQLRTEPDESGCKPSVLVSTWVKPTQVSSKYQIEGVAGKGTFGVVYFGVVRGTGERIAIKKVLQDRKYKNREHQIMRMLEHPNNLAMRESLATVEGEGEYLNIVMDYYSDNLYQLVKKKQVCSLLTKLYAYQLFRGLNYLAMLSIAHRDIKPHNILVDCANHHLVISDFGSAKQLVSTEPNLAYICSRCYRAPQLIFGATNYSPQIDMWSSGCVLVEMVNGVPPFLGDSQVDQLKEIIKGLGTPSEQEVRDMNKEFDMKEFKRLPQIKKTPWSQSLQSKDPLLIDLVTRVLKYSPSSRITPGQALMHEYFDDLRDEGKYQEMLYKVKEVPELFDFSKKELGFIFETTKMQFDLVPEWTLRKPVTLHLGTNKATTSSTNTKRSILSFKAL